MEGEFKQVSAQNLECPVCLNIFNEPKILSCSHTFCKACLTRLLESQPDGGKLPCPVCREVTDLPSGNVSQLKTVIALKSLVEDVKNQHQICTNCKCKEMPEAVIYCQDCGKYLCVSCHKAHSLWEGFSAHRVLSMADVLTGKVSIKRRHKCKKHPNEDEEYFCSDCQKYICFRCGVMEHERKGHIIMESMEYEDKQKRNIDELESKADTKTILIKKYIECIEEQRERLKGVLGHLDDSVIKAYEEAVQQLTQRKESLRNEIKQHFERLDKELYGMEAKSREQIIHVNAVRELVGNGRKVPLEKEALTAHDTLCKDLKEILGREDPDLEKPRNSVKRGEKISFERNKGMNELDLGRVGITKWQCNDVAFSKINSMEGMAATPDAMMAVGCHEGGIELFSPDAQLQHTLLNHVGIRMVGFLSDGRYVVRGTNNDISLYTPECEKLDVRFETLSKDEGGFGGVTVDSGDHIYVSYRKAKKIQVFTSAGGQAVGEIHCHGYEPMQISAIKSNKILVVKSSDYSVGLIDESGVIKNEVNKGDDISPFPAVCHGNLIVIAWVKHREGLVSIDRYTSELKHVTTLITDHKIHKPERDWYYLQEFVSGQLAFCTPDRLYVFHKSVIPVRV